MSKSRKTSTKTIKVNYLARVEGEGGLFIKAVDGKVKDVQLKIFEPPRFFEALLKGRAFSEAPDITARICGICPVAYQMSSCQAMESICGVSVEEPLRSIRRLLYCGEWIKSHTLHIHMLHAPDFLGYPGVVQMAKDYPAAVERGLRLQKAGNDLMTLVGGREIHPINVRVGGFYKLPTKNELLSLAEQLKQAREDAIETLKWVAGFKFPEFEKDYEFVSMKHAHEYPMNEGRIVSNKGLDISISEFEDNFVESQVDYSTALHVVNKERGDYFVGPMARYNLNFDLLSPTTRQLAKAYGLTPPCNSPFKSIAIRSIEVIYACEEALRIVESYKPGADPFIKVTPRAGEGYGCTEAPRGLLYHRYAIDEDGLITYAKIIPPTSQNQKIIETDLRHFVEKYFSLEKEVLQHHCEQAIRNYDPCISCATHFLKMHIDKA